MQVAGADRGDRLVTYCVGVPNADRRNTNPSLPHSLLSLISDFLLHRRLSSSSLPAFTVTITVPIAVHVIITYFWRSSPYCSITGRLHDS